MVEQLQAIDRKYPPFDRSAWLVTVWMIVISLAVSIFASLRGYDVLPDSGPPGRNAEVTRSLWRDGTVAAPEFRMFEEFFRNWSQRDHVTVRQDVYAESADGRLVPKHSPISAFIALPFYAVFGDPGFWICQQFCVVLTMLAAFQICRVVTGRDDVLTFVLVSALLSQTFICLYGYIFSYDFHGGMFLVCGLYLMRTRPCAGAFLMGLSIFVRVTNVLFLPFLMVAWPEFDRRDYLAVFAGFAAAAVCFLYFDWLLFGDPLATAYHRLPLYQKDGAIVFEHHPLGFNLQIFASEWRRKLLGPEIGLIVSNPGICLLAFLPLRISRMPGRRFVLVTSAAAICYILYIFSYEEWHTSFLGNRFLMPAILIANFAVTAILSDVRECRLKRKMGA